MQHAWNQSASDRRAQRVSAKPEPDFLVSGGGTLYFFHPLTAQAAQWLDAHCPADGEHHYLGRALAVEHRYLADLVQCAVADGLVAHPRLLP